MSYLVRCNNPADPTDTDNGTPVEGLLGALRMCQFLAKHSPHIRVINTYTGTAIWPVTPADQERRKLWASQ